MQEASEEQKRAIREKLDSFSDYIGRRTVTFHWQDEAGVPWQNGTGVLLRISHRYFIITAAHVTDEIATKHANHKPTFIIGGGMVEHGLIPLDRVVLLSSPLDGKKRQWTDLYDIAVIELFPHIAKEMVEHNAWLELDQLDLDVEQNAGGHFYIFGFVSALNEPDRDRRVLTATAFPIVTGLFTKDLSELLFFDPAIGLVFNFDAHVGAAESGPRVAPPLGGISGCGIWQIVSADRQFMDCDPAEAKLVAIEHKEVTSSKVLVGTRIKYALQMIVREWPDLQEPINSVFRSLV